MTTESNFAATSSAQKYECPCCNYVYDPDLGEPKEGFAAGTPFADIPDDWECPDCGVRDKVDFEPVV